MFHTREPHSFALKFSYKKIILNDGMKWDIIIKQFETIYVDFMGNNNISFQYTFYIYEIEMIQHTCVSISIDRNIYNILWGGVITFLTDEIVFLVKLQNLKEPHSREKKIPKDLVGMQNGDYEIPFEVSRFGTKPQQRSLVENGLLVCTLYSIILLIVENFICFHYIYLYY